MGQVFRGTVRGSGAAVAVKVLKPELVSDPEVVARFFQERSILTSINHPSVVRVVDLVVEGYTLAIVMELVQGPDLRRFLQARRTLPPAEAVQLVRQLLAGLAAVHAAGIVHRDVKPENMLLDTTDGQARVRLTDFGVARLSYGASLTKLSSIIGTPEYMAPEVADHDSAAPSADLYSAGVVLYEMLSGRTPFAGGHPLAVLRRQVEQPPPPIPGIPAPLWAQLETLLAKEPESRPASAVQAADSLALLTESLADMPPLPLMPQPAPGTWAPSRATTGGGAVPDTPRTIARHRHREAGADDGSPVPADSGTGHKRPGGPRWRPRPAVIALPASLVILAAVAGVALVRSHHPDPVARAGYQTVSYTFAPQQYHDGLLIVRRWALSGKDGSLLTETVTASSATGKALHAPFEEAIPAEITPTLRAVRFAPAPGQIVQADPVVEWNLKRRPGFRHRWLPGAGSVRGCDQNPAATLGKRPHQPPAPPQPGRSHDPAQVADDERANASSGHRGDRAAYGQRCAQQRESRPAQHRFCGGVEQRGPRRRNRRAVRESDRDRTWHDLRDRADRRGAGHCRRNRDQQPARRGRRQRLSDDYQQQRRR